MDKLHFVRYCLYYFISPWLLFSDSDGLTIYFTLLIFISYIFYFVDFAVFSIVCFTPSNAVVLQNNLRLFNLQASLLTVLNCRFLFSFLLLLPPSYWIWLLLRSFFCYLHHFLLSFTQPSFYLLLIDSHSFWPLFFFICVFSSCSVFTCLLFLPLFTFTFSLLLLFVNLAYLIQLSSYCSFATFCSLKTTLFFLNDFYVAAFLLVRNSY